MKTFACVEDLRKAARNRVPKMFYDYVDSGSWTESTYRANAHDLQKIRLRQRVAVDVSARTTASTMLGQPVSMPVAASPTGLTGMTWPGGELLVQKACEEFRVPFTLSTVSIASIEDVARSATQPFWFQLYIIKDRSFTDKLMDRAEAAGVTTLVLTLDLQMVGQRHKDIHNGLSSPPKPTLRNLFNLATKPAWCIDMLRVRKMDFGNLEGHVHEINGKRSLAEWTDAQFDPSLNWDDVSRIRERWKGKLILKGINDPDDAIRASEIGADAIVVSNHGGRQLDGAPSTIAALPAIVDAIGGRLELLIDGGFTSGQDVFKAMAFGAQGVMLGRAMLYGLGAAGGPGVTRALQIIQKELSTTMGLCGVNRVSEIDHCNIFPPDRLFATSPTAAQAGQ
jgi:L-lactate dehydrogenase (cytochrome)